ncbi:tetratricopeptide repeat protein [Dactylosporangium sp. NPDC051485]|uniref:tetratricopeptide repeat protein n=1 Tax=Dactylosporangium sp. NPDC051485 TaxID=3154846 RepID=UPI00341553AC
MAAFVALLRQLKQDSGCTYRQLEARAAQRGDVLARSTIADTLRREALPRPETLVAFVRACAPRQDVQAWLEARARLAAGDPGPSTSADPGAATAQVVPRQLPAPPGLFTGRALELDHLDQMARRQSPNRTVVISAIGGAGGIGKTSLALHWAHTHLDAFPDGQLYADLRGFGPGPGPVPPDAALRGFLGALGIPPASVPRDLDAQAGLYRSLLASRRMLIMLDNARDTAQVLPLLPGSPSCTVLVTSRHQLRGLTVTHGARLLALDLLRDDDARDLLAEHLGQHRAAQQPHALATLVEYCGGLPLALAIVAARAASHPDHPLDALVLELRDATARLSALNAGELRADLRAVFSWSYRALRQPSAKLFDLLGLAPGADISLAAVASLAGAPVPRARELLLELEDTSLVRQHAPGQYRMHDLVRLYSVEQTQAAPSHEAALRRLVDFYLHTACAADRLLDPRRPPLALSKPAPGVTPQPLSDPAEAMAWFDLEHTRILDTQRLAMDRGWYAQVWQLARTLVTFHARRRRGRDQLTVWQLALAAVDREGSHAAAALAHRYLGQAHTAEGEHGEALRHLQLALVRAAEAADAGEQARTHYALTVAWERTGDHEQALVHANQALTLFRDLGDPVEQARAHNAVGWMCAQLRRYEQARSHCERALTLFRRNGHPDGEADTLHSLGLIAYRNGEYPDALRYYREALAMYHEVGNTRGEVDCLESLGQLHQALSRYAEAHEAWQQALDLLHTQHRTKEALLLSERMQSLRLSGRERAG